jgi:RING/U-box domain-containing protein
MGISSMPAPRDSLVAYLLYSTAVSIAALAGLDLQDPGDDAAAGDRLAASGTGVERFRSRFGATGCEASDCRVCLARFEPESVVSRLPCGHLFHSGCLETWLRYDRATCPLCRARLLPLAVDEPSPPAPLPTAAY